MQKETDKTISELIKASKLSKINNTNNFIIPKNIKIENISVNKSNASRIHPFNSFKETDQNKALFGEISSKFFNNDKLKIVDDKNSYKGLDDIYDFSGKKSSEKNKKNRYKKSKARDSFSSSNAMFFFNVNKQAKELETLQKKVVNDTTNAHSKQEKNNENEIHLIKHNSENIQKEIKTNNNKDDSDQANKNKTENQNDVFSKNHNDINEKIEKNTKETKNNSHFLQQIKNVNASNKIKTSKTFAISIPKKFNNNSNFSMKNNENSNVINTYNNYGRHNNNFNKISILDDAIEEKTYINENRNFIIGNSTYYDNYNNKQALSNFRFNEKTSKNKVNKIRLDNMYNLIEKNKAIYNSLKFLDSVKNSTNFDDDKSINYINLCDDQLNSTTTDRNNYTASINFNFNRNQKDSQHVKKLDEIKDLSKFKNSILYNHNNQKYLARLKNNTQEFLERGYLSVNTINKEDENTPKTIISNSQEKKHSSFVKSIKSLNLKEGFMNNIEHYYKTSKSPTVTFNSGSFNLPLLSILETKQ